MVEIWKEDFETGVHSFDTIDTRDGNALEVVAESPRSGAYALAVIMAGTSGMCTGIKTIPSTGTIHAVISILVPSMLTLTGNITVFRASGPGGESVRLVIDGAGNWQVVFGGVGWTGNLPQKITRDIYHVMEIFYSVGSPGYCAVYLDNILQYETSGGTSGYNVDLLSYGNIWGTSSTIGRFYLDDLFVETFEEPPPPPPEIAKLNFETGDLSEFSRTETKPGNILEVTTTQVYSGNYGLRAHVTGVSGVAYGQVNFISNPNIHFTLPIFIPNDLVITGYYPFLTFRQGQDYVFGLKLTPTGWVIEFKLSDGSKLWVEAELPPITKGQWHVIEGYLASRLSGNLIFKLDGVTVYEREAVNTSGINVDSVRLGALWVDAAEGDLFFDDFTLEEWTPPSPAPLPPIARFFSSPWRQAPNQPVTFDGTLSYDPDGTIVHWAWDFGDGTSAEGATVAHAYALEGEYTATLTVTDNDGLSKTVSSIVTISTTPIIVTPSSLHIEGRWIKDASGKVVMLRGVNKGSFGGQPGCMWGKNGVAIYDFEEETARKELDAMKAWGINCIRFPVCIEFWRKNIDNHREKIKRVIEIAQEKDMYVIYCPYQLTPAAWPLASFPWPLWSTGEVISSEDDFVNYLTSVAAELIQYRNVIFEIYNEPCAGNQMELWRNPAVRDNWFKTVQRCISNLRALGSNHLIIVSWGVALYYADWDPPYSINLSWIQQYPLTGGNIVYNNHLYFWSNVGSDYIIIKQRLGDMLVNDVGAVYNKPLMFNEIGAQYNSIQELAFFKNALQILNEWNISYCAWQWRGDKAAGNEVVIDDWYFTPNPAGDILKEAIAVPPPPTLPIALISLPIGFSMLAIAMEGVK